MDWFYHDLIILVKQCKTPYKNLDKALLFSRRQVFSMKKKRKLWVASTTIEFNIFCWNFAHISHLPMSTNGCFGFFFICLDCVTCKNKKRPGFYTLVFDIFLKNSRSKQSKQIPNNLVGSVCKVSAENVKLCGSSACQSFQFFRQIA